MRVPNFSTAHNLSAAHNRRAGFTLVEVLMVVVIIGILASLIIPAVNIGLKSVRQKAIALECQTIATAIDQYRTKYGDYPPDGSNAELVARHLRKAFPNMAASELTILTAASNSSTGGMMDPTESLVFFLGGFSSDPVHPFTGKGGPFAPTPSGSRAPYQYNVDRENAFFEFKQSQLSLDIQNDPDSNAAITVSVDETDYGFTTPTDFLGDLLPVYRPAQKKSPYVYFDSRTYYATAGIQSYLSSTGRVGPYLSATLNTKAATTPATYANRLNYFRFVNDKSFQLLCAGLDDQYGDNISGSVVYVFRPIEDDGKDGEPKSGQAFDVLGAIASGERYPQIAANITGFKSADSIVQLDNCSNFSNGPLVDSVK